MNENYTNETEEHLWHRYTHNNDHNAFANLVASHCEPVLAYLIRMLRDPDDAFDLLQETLRRFAFNYDPAKASPKTFLFRIAVNLARSHYKKKTRRQEISLNDLCEKGFDIPDWNQQSDEKMKTALLDDALSRLKANDREAIDLKDIQGFSYKSAAQILNCSEKRFEKRLAKARKRLQTILTENPKYESLLEGIF